MDLVNGLPRSVRLVEVGPRDGLQNQPVILATHEKLEFIRLLVDAGLRDIEVASFVRPDRVPQVADADTLIPRLPHSDGIRYSALVPNEKGLDRAIQSGIQRIAVFTAASETFNRKNINMGIQESIAVFRPLVKRALENGISARGYVSTCFVCPYEGAIPKERVLDVTQGLLDLGVDEVSIGDTIGAATPVDVEITASHLLSSVPREVIAMHFHDTYGMAVANVFAALRLGIATFDSSAGGIGGCPFAPGAAGNVATETLLYLFERLKIETGVSAERLREAVQYVRQQLRTT